VEGGGAVLLDEIIKSNQEFSAPPPIAKGIQRGILVFTCIDSRLVGGFLEEALGISRGEASVVKNAGLLVTDDVVRSLAMALYSFDVREIFVVGHSDCAAASFQAYDITEAMKKKGLGREVIPSTDLRAFFGATSSERGRVRESVEALRKSSLIPRDVPIHGLILDSASGKLEVIVKGYDALRTTEVKAAGAPQEQKAPSTLDRAVEWMKETSRDVKADLFGSKGTALFDRPVEPAPARKDEPPKAGEVGPMNWEVSSNAAFASDSELLKKETAGRVSGWYDNQSSAQVTSQPSSQTTPPQPSFDTQSMAGKIIKGSEQAQDSLERFEVWLEDLGLFSEDVKKELKRITGLTIDDLSALRKAIMSTQSPQEAQKIKRQLQSMGAKAIIRRVKKIIK
jgi:carbonic anhydrase